jgi:hypothetical protein
LSLFVTLVDEILMQDPDLESARFEILDFSCPRPNMPRTLRIIDARDVPRVSEQQKNVMLETFAEGYFQAREILSGKTFPDRGKKDKPSKYDSDQPDLFD